MLSRRLFLTQLGIGTYELLRGSSSVAIAAQAAKSLKKTKATRVPFKKISPSSEDILKLAAGFRHDVVISYGDLLGSTGPFGPEAFGYDNDFLASFPIDALTGGKNSKDLLLWSNHEYVLSLFVSGTLDGSKKTQAMIQKEKQSVGGSVVRIQYQNGKWKPILDPATNHRYTARYPQVAMTGPAKSKFSEALGTLANCSGGKTSWNTVLSCEENFQLCNPLDELGWSNVEQEAINEEHYGWVVEVDPFRKLAPKKHSSLGRFCHENAAIRIGADGRLVVYMGDDSKDQFFYKFVSNEKYSPILTREAASKLLESGTLYAGDFVYGKWLPLDIEKNPRLREAGFKSQEEVLIQTRKAAAAAGASPMDRPEDCEIHPKDGSVYIAFTNNSNRGNYFGQIVRLIEKGDDAEAMEFKYEILLTGGPESGMAAPDNLCFDRHGNLWVCCDVSSGDLGKGKYAPFQNNGLFFVPTSGSNAGTAYQFASAPVAAELTGPCFTADEKTLFLSVQHPGETSTEVDSPTSRWPKGGNHAPLPSVVAIQGF